MAKELGRSRPYTLRFAPVIFILFRVAMVGTENGFVGTRELTIPSEDTNTWRNVCCRPCVYWQSHLPMDLSVLRVNKEADIRGKGDSSVDKSAFSVSMGN